MSKLCWLIIKRYKDGQGLKTPSEIEQFLLSAAYSGDRKLLEEILLMHVNLDLRSGFKELIQACLEFGDDNQNWLRTINTSGRQMISLEKNEILDSEFIKYVKNFHPQENYYWILDEIECNQVQDDVGEYTHQTIGLISCDLKYFIIYAEYFCAQFRKNNDIELIFFVVLDNDSDLAKFSEISGCLEKYTAVNVRSRQASIDNMAIEVTNERFIVASDVMFEQLCNVLILDIDLKIDFDVVRVCADPERSLSLPIGVGGVPWGRYIAGLIHFPYSNFSMYFLKLMQEYIAFALKHDPQWTLDQATIAVIVQYLRHNNVDFEFHDTGLDLYVKATRSVPMRLRIAKNRAKGSNLALMRKQ